MSDLKMNYECSLCFVINNKSKMKRYQLIDVCGILVAINEIQKMQKIYEVEAKKQDNAEKRDIHRVTEASYHICEEKLIDFFICRVEDIVVEISERGKRDGRKN